MLHILSPANKSNTSTVKGSDAYWTMPVNYPVILHFFYVCMCVLYAE